MELLMTIYTPSLTPLVSSGSTCNLQWTVSELYLSMSRRHPFAVHWWLSWAQWAQTMQEADQSTLHSYLPALCWQELSFWFSHAIHSEWWLLPWYMCMSMIYGHWFLVNPCRMTRWLLRDSLVRRREHWRESRRTCTLTSEELQKLIGTIIHYLTCLLAYLAELSRMPQIPLI